MRNTQRLWCIKKGRTRSLYWDMWIWEARSGVAFMRLCLGGGLIPGVAANSARQPAVVRSLPWHDPTCFEPWWKSHCKFTTWGSRNICFSAHAMFMTEPVSTSWEYVIIHCQQWRHGPGYPSHAMFCDVLRLMTEKRLSTAHTMKPWENLRPSFYYHEKES